jgi:hypothetical protein
MNLTSNAVKESRRERKRVGETTNRAWNDTTSSKILHASHPNCSQAQQLAGMMLGFF